MQWLSLAMQIFSAVSAAASLTTVVMYLRFPHLQKKSYFTLQYYVAVSNVLTSIGSAIGVVQTGTVACWFQGILTNIFTLSSIQWTTVMAFSLFSIVHYDKQLKVTPLVHAYCWIPPIIATLLPLINSTYGNVGNWCWVVSKSSTPPWGEMVWFWFSFYGWVWISLLMMVFILAEIKYVSVKRNATSLIKTHSKLDKVIHTLNLFPLIIFVSWGPVCSSDTMLVLLNVYNAELGAVGLLLACLQGFFTAILFWTRNEDARRLFQHPQIYDSRNTSSKIESNHSSHDSELNSNLAAVAGIMKTDHSTAPNNSTVWAAFAKTSHDGKDEKVARAAAVAAPIDLEDNSVRDFTSK